MIDPSPYKVAALIVGALPLLLVTLYVAARVVAWGAGRSWFEVRNKYSNSTTAQKKENGNGITEEDDDR